MGRRRRLARESIGLIARAAIRERTLWLLERGPKPFDREDTDDLHRARVSVRRLRSLLRAFRGSLPAEARELRSQLGGFGSVLGPARDLDVFIGWVREQQVPHSEPIVELLEAKRLLAYATADEAVTGDRTITLVHDLIDLSETSLTTDDEAVPVGLAAPELVRKSFKRVRTVARTALEDPTPEKLHAVRIRSKALRYLSEPLIDLYGKPAKRLAEAAESIQSILGKHHDASVWADVLAESSGPRFFDVATAFAGGRLAERIRAGGDEAVEGFEDAWETLRGKRWKRMDHALTAIACEAEWRQ